MVTLVFDGHDLENCIIFDRLYFPYWLEKRELGQCREKRRCVSSSWGCEAPLLNQMWNETVAHFKKRDYLPIFCTILFLKKAPGSQAGLPMLPQSEFGPAALFFSERLVLVLHRHNKSTHHLRSCCGVYISVSIWISLNDWNHKPSCSSLYKWRTLSDMMDLYVASECTTTCKKINK